MTSDDIFAARRIIEAASKGPARWATLAPVDMEPQKAFQQLLDAGIETRVHGVAIPVPGQTVDEIDGGECLYVCLTGNGPTSVANARFIAGSFDPVAGWAAALDEIERLHKLVERMPLRKA